VLTRLDRRSRRFYIWLSVAIALGLAIRLFYAVHYKWDQPISGDAFYYSFQARAVVQGLGFINPYAFFAFKRGVLQSVEHPPLYTLFLTIPTVFGFHTFREHMVSSCVLGSFTVGAVGLAGRSIAGARTGIVAAFLAAIYANLWINDSLVLSETVTALLLALAVWTTYRFWREPSLRRGMWLGLVCGFAVLARTEIAFYVLLVAPPLALRAYRSDLKASLQRLGAIGLVAALPVVGWVAFNWVRIGQPVFTTGGDETLAIANCNATYYGPRLGWWYFDCVKLPAHLQAAGDLATAKFDRREALHYVGSHLDRVPVVAAARVGRLWEIYRPGQTLDLDVADGRGPHEIAVLALAQYYVLVPLVILGLVLLRRRRIIIYPLLALAGVATIAAILAFGNVRYRLPGDVAFVLAAAVPITALLDHWRPGPLTGRSPSGTGDATVEGPVTPTPQGADGAPLAAEDVAPGR
jgi:hypothetical protein